MCSKSDDLLSISSAEGAIRVGHLRVNIKTSDQLIETLMRVAFEAKETHLVVTANAQFYVLGYQNLAFRQVLETAEFVCADGVSIVLATRLLARRSVKRVAGVDLILQLCSAGAERGVRVFLLGGQPRAADQTAQLLKKNSPTLTVVGTACPPLGFENDHTVLSDLLKAISEAKPHIIFVALGAPKQEFFIHGHLRALRIPVAIGVGGSFDILSGCIPRAPIWIQDCGLEWAFRLCREPRRLWRRYLIGNALFIFYMLRALIRKNRR